MTAQILIEMEQSKTALLTKRKSVFRRPNKTTDSSIADTDDRPKHTREIGKIVARDFSSAGVKYIEKVVKT
jgi:hypothetical protein